MNKWYVKDLSKLTGVSVQTLHHYDRIGLLKPQFRQANGYRLYSEADLLCLEHIVALKFFGFELSQIKEFLSGDADAFEHFAVQAELLKKKADRLLEASNMLQNILVDQEDHKSIPWETIVKLIEVYRMIQQLEHPWVKNIFTPNELKQYVDVKAEWQKNSTEAQLLEFERNWSAMVEDIRQNQDKDPSSKIGIERGKTLMQLINQVYGKEYAHLRTKKFEKGFGEGMGLEELNLSPESVAWLEKAVNAYLADRVYHILKKVGIEPADLLLKLWNEALDEMYGNETARKKELCQMLLLDDKVSQQAKNWLKTLSYS